MPSPAATATTLHATITGPTTGAAPTARDHLTTTLHTAADQLTEPGFDLAAGAIALLPLAAAAITAGYLLWCWLYPFTRCRRCEGTGHRRKFLASARRLEGHHRFGHALCRRCHGSRYQLRPGRVVLNHLRAVHARADRTAVTTRPTTIRPAAPAGRPTTPAAGRTTEGSTR